ncbi:FtsX-like permease family protein, partial [Ideonella sp.]|uniref:FtsX-like permease family protein n=1 Tax=Ideonella sp. TaxID=1929293 RepID=UPI003BB6CED5
PDLDPRAPLWPGNPMVGKALAMVGFDSQGNGWTEEQREAIYVANGRVFARLQPGAQAQQVGGWMREAFRANPRYAQLPADWREGREAAYFRAVPAADWPFEGELNELRWQLLGAVAAASALLLLLAAVNGMNLQAASLLQRQRETALRRSLGADGLQLLRLWALEAALPLLLAGAAAMLLAWWVAPAVGGWIGLPPEQAVADPVPNPIWLGWALVLLVLWPATLALPAWAALRRAPAPALQGRTASEGPWGRRVRQGLLAVQLGGALLLLSLAGVMAVQQQHLLSADRGFETRNRLWLGVMVNPDFIPDLGPFLAALGQHPAVSHWAFSNVRPAGDTRGQTELHLSPGGQRQVLRVTTVSPSFFATYGMTLLAGQPELGGGEQRVVIDAKAARLLGFASPQAALGALLRGGGDFLQAGELQRRVVAVVADVKMESARDQPLPQAFVLTDQPQWDLTVHGPDLAAVRAAVEAVWAAHGPPVPHDTRSADELRADVYQQEAQITALLAGIALLTVGVAMLGAYALVADTVRRRRTELVLRRLHGAGNAAIVAQLARDFALPMLLAMATALPLAAWLGQGYLADFVERIGPVEGLLLPLAVATLLTGLATVVAAWRHARLALRLQPIEALR